MDLQVTFRHIEHTAALDTVIQEKAHKFEKWFHGSYKVHWTCWKDGDEFISEVHLHHNHTDYVAKAHDRDMYKTFDQVVHKIQNQIKL